MTWLESGGASRGRPLSYSTEAPLQTVEKNHVNWCSASLAQSLHEPLLLAWLPPCDDLA